jgi:hypothetical protein
VWEAIYSAKSWPNWWKNVRKVTILKEGHADGTGAVQRHEWGTALPYTLAFEIETTIIERPHLIEGLSNGELVGSGRWELTPEGSGTAVRYDWNVQTTKRWMNLLAPILRPVFAWNHKVVMEEGGKSLARHLGTSLSRPSQHRTRTAAT